MPRQAREYAQVVDLPEMIRTENLGSSVQTLREYYGARYPSMGEDVTARYSGAWFDEYDIDADRENELTSGDLLSLSFLNTPIKGESVIPLTETFREEVNGFLRLIPVDQKLWEVTEKIDSNWAPWALENFLCRNIPQIALTRSSKIIARKRPHLYPINDKVVRKVLNPRGGYVSSIHLALQDERLRDFLEESRNRANLPEAISLLRVLDVICWMDGKRKGL